MERARSSTFVDDLCVEVLAGPERHRLTHSAVIVPVPGAESVVSRHRQVLDRAAAWGVPAHVTVLYPFLAPVGITSNSVAQLRAIFARVTAFDCRFGKVKWFDQGVVWLAPEPDEPFRAMTRAVCDAFPGHLPYEGAYPDPVPHMTIGHSPTADLAAMRHAAAQVTAALPVTARIDRARLIAGTDAPNSWQTLCEFSLSTARTS